MSPLATTPQVRELHATVKVLADHHFDQELTSAGGEVDRSVYDRGVEDFVEKHREPLSEALQLISNAEDALEKATHAVNQANLELRHLDDLPRWSMERLRRFSFDMSRTAQDDLLRRAVAAQATARTNRDGGRSRFEQAVLSSVLTPAARHARDAGWGHARDDRVRLEDDTSLSSKADPGHFVVTDAYGEVSLALLQPGGATIGLARSRGAGKGELANHFTSAQQGRVSVRTWAPPSGDVEVYLRWLLRRLCEEVRGRPHGVLGSSEDHRGRRLARARRTGALGAAAALAAPATGVVLLIGALTGYDICEHNDHIGVLLIVLAALIASTTLSGRARFLRLTGQYYGHEQIPVDSIHPEDLASHILTRLQFTETVQAGGELSVALGMFGGKAEASRGLQTQLLTRLDLVHDFDRLVTAIRDAGKVVVITIDELDKLSTEEAALTFLNELKVLFPIQGCSLLVSVSDSAWIRYALACRSATVSTAPSTR